MCSPRPRGWSRVGGEPGGLGQVLPALAGSIPNWLPRTAASCVPRACGGGTRQAPGRVRRCRCSLRRGAVRLTGPDSDGDGGVRASGRLRAAGGWTARWFCPVLLSTAPAAGGRGYRRSIGRSVPWRRGIGAGQGGVRACFDCLGCSGSPAAAGMGLRVCRAVVRCPVVGDRVGPCAVGRGREHRGSQWAL
jgi:hypothetical protein